MTRVRKRAWTVILVPPRPGERTRQVTVSSRTLALVGLVSFACVAGAFTWTSGNQAIAAASASRLAESQRTVIALLDSVQTLHVLAERERRAPPRNMVMPVQGQITSRFSTRRLHPILQIFRPHPGVDVAAPTGTPIVAPAAARVRSVGYRSSYGLVIELEHSGEVITRYAHCRSANVRPGDEVFPGDIIGSVGASGLATGPHLHFEVLVAGRQVDPLRFLADSRRPMTADRGADRVLGE